ncbi:MAG: SoxR reducing system RseC family protein [Kangiellaceae bacterium]|nr:SoxR reducing system RseC family protein [Kangiellaceae bacterium]
MAIKAVTNDKMLEEVGLVLSVSNQLVTVQTQSQLACNSCRASTGCGNGIIEKYLSGKMFESEVHNNIGAKVGDRVVIAIPRASLTKASLLVYMVPIISLILTSVLASAIGLSENFVILSGCAGIMAGLMLTKYYNQKWLNSELYSPRLVSIVDSLGGKLTQLRRIKSIEIS